MDKFLLWMIVVTLLQLLHQVNHVVLISIMVGNKGEAIILSVEEGPPEAGVGEGTQLDHVPHHEGCCQQNEDNADNSEDHHW